MLLHKCLSKQHFSFTADYIYSLEKKKGKHCQLWHISRLYDLEGMLEVLLSDFCKPNHTVDAVSDHHPPGRIQNVR